MHGCDLVFAPETAARVRATLREQFGGTCPCDDNQKCPLLPDDIADLMPCKNEEVREPALVPIGPREALDDVDPHAAANQSLSVRLRLVAEEARQSESA